MIWLTFWIYDLDVIVWSLWKEYPRLGCVLCENKLGRFLLYIFWLIIFYLSFFLVVVVGVFHYKVYIIWVYLVELVQRIFLIKWSSCVMLFLIGYMCWGENMVKDHIFVFNGNWVLKWSYFWMNIMVCDWWWFKNC